MREKEQQIQEAIYGDQKVLLKYIFIFSQCNPLKEYDIYYRQHIKCIQIWLAVYILGKPEYDLKIIVIS